MYKSQFRETVTCKRTRGAMRDDNRRMWIDIRVMETSREKDEAWKVSIGTQGLPVKSFLLPGCGSSDLYSWLVITKSVFCLACPSPGCTGRSAKPCPWRRQGEKSLATTLLWGARQLSPEATVERPVQ